MLMLRMYNSPLYIFLCPRTLCAIKQKLERETLFGQKRHCERRGKPLALLWYTYTPRSSYPRYAIPNTHLATLHIYSRAAIIIIIRARLLYFSDRVESFPTSRLSTSVRSALYMRIMANIPNHQFTCVCGMTLASSNSLFAIAIIHLYDIILLFDEFRFLLVLRATLDIVYIHSSSNHPGWCIFSQLLRFRVFSTHTWILSFKLSTQNVFFYSNIHSIHVVLSYERIAPRKTLQAAQSQPRDVYTPSSSYIYPHSSSLQRAGQSNFSPTRKILILYIILSKSFTRCNVPRMTDFHSARARLLPRRRRSIALDNISLAA